MIRWHLVHTKIRQERVAMAHLERQGYSCFLPLLWTEKLRKGAVHTTQEPLFPRYLFIRLDNTAQSSQSWGPIRSTVGVSRLVSFGNTPATLDDGLVEQLRAQSLAAAQTPQRLFSPGDAVQVTAGAFAGLDAVYQMADGDSRVMVLLHLLSQPVSLSVSPASLRKLA